MTNEFIPYEYAKTITNLPKQNEHDVGIFIAGANSKFVKQQLLLAQIDILKKLSIDTVYFYNTKEGRFTKKLQEKLKQLQDEQYY